MHISLGHQALDTRIFYKECRTLAAVGYDVHLVIPSPPGQQLASVVFHAVDTFDLASHRMSPGKRFSRVLARLRALLNAYKVAKDLEADVYHLHDTLLIPVGILLKLRGAKAIYDVHEDFPQEALSLNKVRPVYGKLLSCLWRTLEGAAKLLFDGIVAATPTIAEKFPQGKTVTVHNYPDLGEQTFDEVLPYAMRQPLIVYLGGIFIVRGIKEMVEAMSLLPGIPDAKLALGGRFDPPELEEDIKQLPGWKRTEFLGWLSRAQVGHLLGQSRIGMVVLHPTPEFRVSLPIKLFEYMAAGIPVVASDFLLWRTIVEEINCGLLVDPLDPRAIAAAVSWLLEHPDEAEAMGRRGRDAVWERYNWEKEGATLLGFYRRLTG